MLNVVEQTTNDVLSVDGSIIVQSRMDHFAEVVITTEANKLGSVTGNQVMDQQEILQILSRYE
ncbi:hypothetical protein [Chitinophaga rhizophila]|uniref:Uncharacterized protein n=1 Tax=Chitinophaga rhizophila TaxID=2866212 RepID=A0ABS7G6A0_9BACT|nr:hypothetical protein [Chitinophaga rhizophila]MBW8683178.1 hypothetical protein [Chitinophaga rhizophila]